MFRIRRAARLQHGTWGYTSHMEWRDPGDMGTNNYVVERGIYDSHQVPSHCSCSPATCSRCPIWMRRIVLSNSSGHHVWAIYISTRFPSESSFHSLSACPQPFILLLYLCTTTSRVFFNSLSICPWNRCLLIDEWRVDLIGWDTYSMSQTRWHWIRIGLRVAFEVLSLVFTLYTCKM